MRIVKTLFLCAISICLLAGCGSNDPTQTTTQPEQQPTQIQNENIEKPVIQLNLPAEFEDYTGNPYTEGYYLYYSNGNIDIGCIHLAKQQGYVFEDYVNQEAEYYRGSLTQKDGFWTLTYEDTDTNEPQTMVNVYYETEDSYWMVQGCCPSQSFAAQESQIWQYITGATFAG